ncbi:Methyltransferase type 11 [Corchorus olitorius]|uniref:Methyltransferase type 11 n=1 Tax=Corchorus olitorius TaxID=93759 RepID=A0A1R3ICT1_9ROSI|nr:Methyltransferase type 11 [Corchorus olitorius]
MAQEYFKPAEGGILVDVSCGSGLFSRKFAKSGTYSGVIALDFSENMLRQCNDFIKQDASLLARADVSRLPFSSGSIDAVHAGAALHCWPSPSNAFAEISRVLRSGGVFVGSTFLRYTSSTPWIVRPLRERALQGYNYLTEEEIEDVCTSSGLTNFSKKVQQAFIMFSAQKP